MNKENIDRKLTAEIELFKTFSWYLIGLTTGIASLILTEINIIIEFLVKRSVNLHGEIVLGLLFAAFVFLLLIAFILLRTYFRINRLKKQ